MDANKILSNLTNVSKTGEGKWRSQCPSCLGKNRKLSLRVDGDHLLIHCFGGCKTLNVLESAGLTMKDLFDDSNYNSSPIKKPFSALDALVGLEHEAALISIAADKILNKDWLGKDDIERIKQAKAVISEARQYITNYHSHEDSLRRIRNAVRSPKTR